MQFAKIQNRLCVCIAFREKKYNYRTNKFGDDFAAIELVFEDGGRRLVSDMGTNSTDDIALADDHIHSMHTL